MAFITVTKKDGNKRVLNSDHIIGVIQTAGGYEIHMTDENLNTIISDAEFERLKKVLDIKSDEGSVYEDRGLRSI